MSAPGAFDSLVPYGTGVGIVYSFDPQGTPGPIEIVTISSGRASTPVQVSVNFASLSATSIGSTIYVAGSDVDNALSEANVTFFSFSSGLASALTNFTTSSSTCCAIPTSISESNGNTLVVFYGMSSKLYYATSTDGGTSWSTSQVLATVVTTLEDVSAEFSSASSTVGVSYLDYEGGSPAQFLDFASLNTGASTTTTSTTSTTTMSSSTITGFSNDQPASVVEGQPNFQSATCSSASQTATSMCTPYGLAFASGNLWVADEGDSRVLQFSSSALTSNGQAASLAIGATSLTGGRCSTSITSSSSGNCVGDIREIAFNSSGDLFVADHGSEGIDVFAPPFSTGMTGSLALGGQGCNSIASAICQPDGMAFDSKGNLWVADGSLARVLEFTPPFYPGESASVVIGQPDFVTRSSTGACNPATSLSLLCEPKGVAFDSSGDLWVSDYGGDRVLEFIPGTSGCAANQFCNGMSASLVVGSGCPISSPYNPTATTLCEPRGIAFDSSGHLWVADTGEYRVLEFASPFTGGAILVLGQPDFTSGSSQSTSQTSIYPEDIAFDASGNLWVSDNSNNRVLEFSITGAASSTTTTTSIGSTTTSTSVSITTSTTSTTSSTTTSSSTSQTPPLATVYITLNPDITSNAIGGNNYFLVSYNDGAQESAPQQGGTLTLEAAVGTQIIIAAASSSSNSQEEWCLQGNYAGSCNPIVIDVTATGGSYTYTYFDVLAQSVSYSISGGGSPIAPEMSFLTLPLTANSNDDYGLATITLSTAAQTIWALRTYSGAQPVQLNNFGIINTSPPTSNEQWSAGFASCCAITGPNVIPNPIVFHNQYAQQVSYSVTGKSGYTAPILTFVSGGINQKYTLGTNPLTLYIDSGSSWSVSNPLPGSTTSYAWSATSGSITSGTITGPGTIDPTYAGAFVLRLMESSGISDFAHVLPEITYKLSLVETSTLSDFASIVHNVQYKLSLVESSTISDFANAIHETQFQLSLVENTAVSDIYNSFIAPILQLADKVGAQDAQNNNVALPYTGKISFIVHSPVNILVTDSLGGHAGFNATGSVVNTIPGAQVIPKNVTQLETVIISDPLTGNYIVQVFPINGGGTYTLECQVTNSNGTVITDTNQTGAVTSGSQYLGVTLSSNGHASETAPSITPPFQNNPISSTLMVLALVAIAVAVVGGVFVLRRRTKKSS